MCPGLGQQDWQSAQKNLASSSGSPQHPAPPGSLRTKEDRLPSEDHVPRSCPEALTLRDPHPSPPDTPASILTPGPLSSAGPAPRPFFPWGPLDRPKGHRLKRRCRCSHVPVWLRFVQEPICSPAQGLAQVPVPAMAGGPALLVRVLWGVKL